MVTFSKNFAFEQGLSLSGRVPQFKNCDVQLLPSSETMASVWRLYKASPNKDNSSAVSYSKFVNNYLEHVYSVYCYDHSCN